jgi:LemA protein
MDTGVTILLGAAAFGLVIFVLIYNALVGRRNRVENAFSSIDVMFKKRFDLIPSLVATVKQYASHERETLTKLAELRARASDERVSTDMKVALDNQLTHTLGRLMMVAENYPQLRASEGFQQLQRTLNEVEEQLSASRRAYNAAVTDYNNSVEMFPTNIVAGMFGHKRRQVFAAEEVDRQKPDVAALFRA